VLLGEGKSFCAGADLNWMKEMAGYDEERNLADAKELAWMLRTLYLLGKPTIARVHGSVFGGGVGLVSCCDIAFAAHDATFSLSETKLGLIPATIGPYVVEAIGARHARRYFVSRALSRRRRPFASGSSTTSARSRSSTAGSTSCWPRYSCRAAGAGRSEGADPRGRRASHRQRRDRRYRDADRARARVSRSKEGMAAFLEKRAASWVPEGLREHMSRQSQTSCR
jgi:methylglutaconyl-CoA hydratase